MLYFGRDSVPLNLVYCTFKKQSTSVQGKDYYKCFFRCPQSSKRTSQETAAHFNRLKRSRLSVVIGRFRSILFASVFQGWLAVAIIVIDGSEKHTS